jgi:hypothetical protein
MSASMVGFSRNPATAPPPSTSMTPNGTSVRYGNSTSVAAAPERRWWAMTPR